MKSTRDWIRRPAGILLFCCITSTLYACASVSVDSKSALEGITGARLPVQSIASDARKFLVFGEKDNPTFLIITSKNEDFAYLTNSKGERIQSLKGTGISIDDSTKYASETAGWLQAGFFAGLFGGGVVFSSSNLSGLLVSISISPDGKYLIVVSSNPMNIFELRAVVLNARTGTTLAELKKHKNYVPLGFDQDKVFLLGIGSAFKGLNRYLIVYSLGYLDVIMERQIPTDIPKDAFLTIFDGKMAYFSSRGGFYRYDFESDRVEAFLSPGDKQIWPLEGNEERVLCRIEGMENARLAWFDVSKRSFEPPKVSVPCTNCGIVDLDGTYENAGLVVEDIGGTRAHLGVVNYRTGELVPIWSGDVLGPLDIVDVAEKKYVYFITSGGLFRVDLTSSNIFLSKH